jgi:hypothetical protein
MDEAAVIRIINATRPGRRIEKFTSADAEEWRIWRAGFETNATIAGWGHVRARREISAAMTGTARQLVEDIPMGDIAVLPAVIQPHGALLDLYEARFLTAADTDRALRAYEDARQSEQEVIMGWHARLRRLYRRAYPLEAANVVELSVQLRRKFVDGLCKKTVRINTYRAHPATYAAALVVANNETAAYEYDTGDVIKPLIKTEPGLNAVGLNAMGQGKDACHFCGRIGHFKRDCRLWKKAQETGRPPARAPGAPAWRGRGGPGQRGRGGRGRGADRGRYASPTYGNRTLSRPAAPSDLRRRINELAEGPAPKAERSEEIANYALAYPGAGN